MLPIDRILLPALCVFQTISHCATIERIAALLAWWHETGGAELAIE
jgi:hypothetical protein